MMSYLWGGAPAPAPASAPASGSAPARPSAATSPLIPPPRRNRGGLLGGGLALACRGARAAPRRRRRRRRSWRRAGPRSRCSGRGGRCTRGTRALPASCWPWARRRAPRGAWCGAGCGLRAASGVLRLAVLVRRALAREPARGQKAKGARMLRRCVPCMHAYNCIYAA